MKIGLLTVIGITLLLPCCSKEDPLERLDKSFTYAESHGDQEAKCAIARQGVQKMNERADNSLAGQQLDSKWRLRQNACAIERL